MASQEPPRPNGKGRLRLGLARLGAAVAPASPRDWTIVVYLVLLLYAFGAGLFVYQPFAGRLSDLRQTQDEAQGQLAYARQLQARRAETEARIAELTAAGNAIGQRLRAGPDEVTFVYHCWQWAEATGVTIGEMTIARPVAAGEGRDQVVTLATSGGYAAQVAFLARIEEGQPLAKVERVSLLPAARTGGSVLDGSFVVHVFSQAGQLAVPAVVTEGVTFSRPAGRRNPFSP